VAYLNTPPPYSPGVTEEEKIYKSEDISQIRVWNVNLGLVLGRSVGTDAENNGAYLTLKYVRTELLVTLKLGITF
jgi:hypothetical protein